MKQSIYNEQGNEIFTPANPAIVKSENAPDTTARLDDIQTKLNQLATMVTRLTSVETKLTSVDTKTPALATGHIVTKQGQRHTLNSTLATVSSLAINVWRYSAYIDVNTYSEVAASSFTNNSTELHTLKLDWSHDGVSSHVFEEVQSVTGRSGVFLEAKPKARYVRFGIKNNGTLAMNTQLWLLLKG